MTGTGLLTALAVAASVLLWTAAAVAWAARHGAFASARRDWRGCPRLRKALAVVALAAAAAWAGTKPEAGEIIELGNNRIIESAARTGEILAAKNAKDARGESEESTDDTDCHGLSRIAEEGKTNLSDLADFAFSAYFAAEKQDGAEIGLAAENAKDAKSGDVNLSTPLHFYTAKQSSPRLRTSTVSAFSDSNPTPSYALSRVGTNEVFSFDPPAGATVAENWRRRGASADWRRISLLDWEFPFGGAAFSNMVVFANGRVRLSSEAGLRPVAAPLGLAPAARRLQVSTNRSESVSIRANPWTNSPASLFWHSLTPSNTLVLTWRDALLHREAANPVSFQAELFPSGGFVFRYDFSRLGDEGLLTNVFAVVRQDGLEGREGQEGREDEFSFPLSRSLTSLSFRSGDERLCDAAREAFDDALGGLDPLACPPGSTNTVWEHYVYTGATNGQFALPLSTESVAVLRVTVAGSGRGELLVGGRAVPLVGQPATAEVSHGGTEARSEDGSAGASEMRPYRTAGGQVLRASVSPCEPSATLFLPVPRGRTLPLYLRADGSLSVSFASSDFAFGRLPDLAANRLTGRINFPNATATTPCFHDYRARRKSVSLPVGEDADALACTWSSAGGKVAVENAPPRSALLTGNFDGRATTPVSYALAHPDYLFGEKTYEQTARFCPKPPEAEDDDEDETSADRHYGERDGDGDEDEDDEDRDYPCGHCVWRLCAKGCGCCPRCRCGTAPEDGSSGGASGEEAEEGDTDEPYEVAVTNRPHLSGVLKIREPLLFASPVRLEVPDGDAPRCCPCPEHATNFVAVAYKSDRLKAVDSDGLDFTRSAETVDVRLAGVKPSRAVGDAFVSFATNGVVCLEGAYTVLGVGVRRDGFDLAALDARNADFGLPVPVTTNADGAAELALATDVGLTGGNVHLGFEGASAPFALWVWDAAAGAYRRLASSDGGALDVSLAAWRRLVGGATDAATARTAVRVTAAGPGAATLVFRYWGVFGGKLVEDTSRQRLTAVASPLRADVDRDGKIGASDAEPALAGRPFRFWSNEDSDKGDFVGQVADATPNAADLKVNGKLDLVNLFPVTVDVSPFVRAWGDAAKVTLRTGTENQRCCVLGEGFSSDDALGLASSSVFTADGEPLEAATLTPLGSDGIDLFALVGQSLSEPVALAFEAAGPVGEGAGPEVVVTLGGAEVYRSRLPVSISSVDDFYRHADVRGAANDAAFAPAVSGEPPNWPDGETDGRHVVFVHGYNVDAAASRTWARAMFKRLWWAGSRSAFTAVDWRGDESRRYVPTQGDISPNYYVNVRHAFMTAPALTALCAGLSGEKVMLAHSLGNVLVSSAAVDHGLAYSRYCMLNAAVPMEAYDAEAQDDLMVDGAWKDLAPRFRASHFANLFASASSDFRAGLSWRGRFAGIRNAVNFYSPTEDVLANPTQVKIFGVETEDFGGAWSKQELFKGCALWHGVNAATFSGTEIEGGWGVNARFVANPLAYVPVVGFNASYFADYTREDMIACPLFTSFDDVRMASTNLLAFADSELLAKMLGDAIPAESFAAGANETTGVSDNYNMQGELTNGWPEDIVEDLPNGARQNVWRHSDIKDVAFWYVYLLFKRLLL